MEQRELLLQKFNQQKMVCTDTRKIEQGAIYFALKGENFNGNEYALKSLDQGCSLAVIDDPEIKGDDRLILVEDVLQSLQFLAADYRDTLTIPIIGITGTNGKTTTKELLHAVLSSAYHCYATEGNFNNHIGVPLSVLKISNQHQIAIIEMGANKGADIMELCEICKPTCGLITNVGQAHLEGFGSFENIKKTKKELYDFLIRKDSLVFINKDNNHLLEMAEGVKNRCYYSLKGDGHINGQVSVSDVNLRFKWNTESSDFSEEIATQLTGKYNLENALAAVTVSRHFKVDTHKIKLSLEKYTPKNNRSQIKNSEFNTLILDAYNANITSTKVALQNLNDITVKDKKKFFILGDMLELGDLSFNAHKEMMELTSELRLEGVFVGAEYEKANTEKKYKCYRTSLELKESIDELKLKEKLILVKGSRGIKLEMVEEVL